MKQTERYNLDPNRFITRIRTSDEFLGSLPKSDLRELPGDKREQALHRAIAAGALSLADHERQQSSNELDASLLELVSGMQEFYEDSRRLEHLREEYGSPRNMSRTVKDQFYDCKETIIRFNDTLGEVINNGASQFNFGELLTFMTNMFSASNKHHVADFHEKAREAIIGMRNEMAVEQLLIVGGVEFRRGTPEEDERGGDFIIEGVPIDFKSKEFYAEKDRRDAEERGYDGSGILWSHINFEDFEGKLALPYDKCEAAFAKLKPELDAAIATGKRLQVAHAI
jgi:hypothetical protein